MRRVASHGLARLFAPIVADPSGFRAGFIALALAAGTGLIAGLTLGALTSTLEELPGLLVLVPAAIAMRGSIFGALGSRLGTAIHAGVFRISSGRDSLVGQNAAASIVLSLVLSAVLAFYAKAVAVAFGVADSISVADFLVVSVLGGAIASILVLAITVWVAALSSKRAWDLDNVAAPIVTSSGDVVALPALFGATLLVEVDVVTPVVALACLATAVLAGISGWRSKRLTLRTIVRESFPVLLVAGAVSSIAGATVEHQAEAFLTYPVFLVLLPPFLGLGGSLGGIIAARLSTKLHLGLLSPRGFDLRPIVDDVTLVVLYALPVFATLGLAGHGAALAVGLETASLRETLAVTMVAGLLVTAAAVVVAYLTAVASQRLGVDPDNVGIPLVTSTLDLGGAFAFVLAIVWLGLA